MLQHAYAGLAAHFGQDGSAAAQQQLAQQHLQAGFNQALTSNNFQELERLSHPDAVAAIAARYWQPAQTQTDYLKGFNPLEGPHLSAAQGGSRSDAGGSAAQSHEQFYGGMATMDYGWAAALADTDSAKILLDGMQHSVPALAARGKEADMLTPERRNTLRAFERHRRGSIYTATQREQGGSGAQHLTPSGSVYGFIILVYRRTCRQRRGLAC